MDVLVAKISQYENNIYETIKRIYRDKYIYKFSNEYLEDDDDEYYDFDGHEVEDKLCHAVNLWCYNPKECIKKYGHISLWDVSGVEDMNNLFHCECGSSCFCGKRSFNEDIRHWDMSNVLTTRKMFQCAHSFNQCLDEWDTSNIVNMSYMFFNCKEFNQPLNSWDTGKAKDMSWMFAHCQKFNQSLNDWNVEQVFGMNHMFFGCKNLNQALNKWKMDKIKKTHFMLSECHKFDQDISNWNMSSNDQTVFYRCKIRPEYKPKNCH